MKKYGKLSRIKGEIFLIKIQGPYDNKIYFEHSLLHSSLSTVATFKLEFH